MMMMMMMITTVSIIGADFFSSYGKARTPPLVLATSKAELHELVDRIDRISRKYNLLINV